MPGFAGIDHTRDAILPCPTSNRLKRFPAPDGSDGRNLSFQYGHTLLSGSDKAHEYRADLRHTALPEMLYTVDRFQVPGVVEAERDGVVKKVYVREGYVVHATSTDRNDSLGSYLQRSGQISAEQFSDTMKVRSGSKKRYGELLVEAGLISPAAIHRAIRKQIESIVWSLFYWQEGQVRFEIGTFQTPTHVKILLPMRQVIVEGIKQAPNAKALVARLGGKDTLFEPKYTTEDLIGTGLDSEEYGLLRLIDGKRTLYELCTEGPLSVPENGKLIYAFHVLKLVRHQATAAEHAQAQGQDSDQARAQGSSAEGGAGAAAAPSAPPSEKSDGTVVTKGVKIKFKTGADRTKK